MADARYMISRFLPRFITGGASLGSPFDDDDRGYEGRFIFIRWGRFAVDIAIGRAA